MADIRGSMNCVEVRFQPQGLRNAIGARIPFSELAGCKPLAFCGIGNPDGFAGTLLTAGLAAEPLRFPDHHHYTEADLQQISGAAAAANADVLLTTHKDLVKLPLEAVNGRPLWAVEIAVDLLSGRELLDQALQRLGGSNGVVLGRK